jgi:hypothetical protein
MSKPRKYLLDSDVFITAKNAYYAFPICPGFWDSMIHHHNAGSLFSIDKVHSASASRSPKSGACLSRMA